MPPVFPEMRDDPIRARKFGDHSRGNRVRLDTLSRLTDRGNMIDIHGQPGHDAFPPANPQFLRF
jgi:hypothetical protein